MRSTYQTFIESGGFTVKTSCWRQHKGVKTPCSTLHTRSSYSLFLACSWCWKADWRLMEQVRLMEWVRPGYNIQACCTQAGPAHAAGHGGGMDRWQHSSHLLLHVLLVASIALLWEKVGVLWVQHRHHESGNKEKQHRDRLPCGYVYRSSHWIGNSVSGLRPCCCHGGVRLPMVHVFKLSSDFELTHDAKRAK